MGTIMVTQLLDVDDLRGELWSGGKDTLDDLSDEEIDKVLTHINASNSDDIMTLGELNDYFWFCRDEIAVLLGYKKYDEILHRGKHYND